MSAVEFVRRDSVVADVGTDHAHLPIHLISKGIAKQCIASDINEGPLEMARKNIASCGISQIETVLSDGLINVEAFDPNDVIIFGMGGELIIKIIDEAKWLFDKSKRLILQPMTKQEAVREYLWSNGFGIIGERLTKDDGKIYQTLCAEYVGEAQTFTPVDIMIGKEPCRARGELFNALVSHRISILENIVSGKRLAGADVGYEEKMIEELGRLI